MQYQMEARKGMTRMLILCSRNTHDQNVLVRRAQRGQARVPFPERKIARAWKEHESEPVGLCSCNAWPQTSLMFFQPPTAYGVFTHRNPVPNPRNDGKWISRSEERRSVIPLLPQEPPRTTLCVPFRGPDGFCGGLSW